MVNRASAPAIRTMPDVGRADVVSSHLVKVSALLTVAGQRSFEVGLINHPLLSKFLFYNFQARELLVILIRVHRTMASRTGHSM